MTSLFRPGTVYVKINQMRSFVFKRDFSDHSFKWREWVSEWIYEQEDEKDVWALKMLF